MTRKEFVEKLFGETLFTENNYDTSIANDKGCQGFECNPITSCLDCSHLHFWNTEVDLSLMSKNVLNMLYGTEQTFYIGGRGNGRTCVIEHAIELQGWQRFPRILDLHDFETIHEIVDDALDNGFEFRLYNSTLYYREKDYANTDSAQDVD